jgi:trigger factor
LDTAEAEELKPITVQTEVTAGEGWAKSVAITVPAEEVSKEFDEIARELGMMLRLPGFRPGKVPRALIEKRFGDDIRKQATTDLLRRAIRSAIDKEKLKIVGEPIVDTEQHIAEKGQAFAFKVQVEVKPSFELTNYKGLAVEQEEVELLPGEMDKALERIASNFAEVKEAPADHAVEMRDMVRGITRYLVDGTEVDKHEASLLVLSNEVLGAHFDLKPEFLVGAKPGDKRSAEGPLDDRFHVEEHRGKKAALEFEVQAVFVRQVPPLDDEMAKKTGCESLEQLKERTRGALLEELGNEIRHKTQYDLLDRVVGTTAFDLPKRLQDLMSSRAEHDVMAYLQRMGADSEALAAHSSKFSEGARERATLEMRRYFVIDAIAEKENLAVAEEEVDDELVRLARERGTRAADLYDQMAADGSLAQLETDLKIRKVLEFLVENAEVKIVPRKPPQEAPAGGEAAAGAASAEAAPAAPPAEAPAGQESEKKDPA